MRWDRVAIIAFCATFWSLAMFGCAHAQANSTVVVVVYDSMTGAVEETVIPDNDGEVQGIIARAAIDFPGDPVAQVPDSLIQQIGFDAALAQYAPNAVVSPSGALDSSVQQALAANALQKEQLQ